MAPREKSFFQDRKTNFYLISKKYSDRSGWISLVRLSIFIVSLVLAIYWANEEEIFLFSLIVVVFFISFAGLVHYHNNLKYKEQHNRFLLQINQDEIDRIENRMAHLDQGIEMIDPDHAYHADLDIFGKHSLFQLLNRTSSSNGKKRLASWLSEPATPEKIRNRQKAIMELSEKIDFIQEFQARGMHYQKKTDTDALLSWMKSKNLLQGNVYFMISSWVFPAISIITFVLFLFSVISAVWLILALIVNSFVLLSILENVGDIHRQTMNSIDVLKALEARLILIEKHQFHSGKLTEIRGKLFYDKEKASKIIGKLKRILMNLENRRNMIYQVFNFFLLLDLHYTMITERWKNKYSDDVRNWMDSVSETEVLISIAGYSHANPEYVFPEIVNTSYCINAQELGHPLIAYEKRKNNDFNLNGKGKTVMITGSNMAGKSTFLRTVGVNAVLALAGAPVCARRLEISPVQIFTSMRTQDVLEENISSFYAELKRIEQLLHLVNIQRNVFFLLDEVLKGTNSKDRHLGAVSLVRQLSGLNTSGLISTHDLDLARETMKSSDVINYSFESMIRDNEIYFDYKLRKGICETFNASKLMEKMGIKLVNG